MKLTAVFQPEEHLLITGVCSPTWSFKYLQLLKHLLLWLQLVVRHAGLEPLHKDAVSRRGASGRVQWLHLPRIAIAAPRPTEESKQFASETKPSQNPDCKTERSQTLNNRVETHRKEIILICHHG